MKTNDNLRKHKDSKHLISMISVESIIRMGYEMNLDEKTKVLDLCCGYGTLLKIWNDTFGVEGVGVDICHDFIQEGKTILKDENNDKILLCEDDVLNYSDEDKYDVVICSETFDSIEKTLSIGQKFLKSNGQLVYCKTYSKVENPPKELLDFEGPLLTLSELNQTFNKLGYYLTHLATDSNDDWERYITYEGRKNLKNIREDSNKENLDWAKKWYKMYFEFRRPYEGQGLFGLVKL